MIEGRRGRIRASERGDPVTIGALCLSGAGGRQGAVGAGIAEAAGVAKGTFCPYLASEDAIFRHLIDDFPDHLSNSIWPGAALSARGPVRAGIGPVSAWAVLGMIERAIHYAVAVAPEAETGGLAREFLALELSGLFGVKN